MVGKLSLPSAVLRDSAKASTHLKLRRLYLQCTNGRVDFILSKIQEHPASSCLFRTVESCQLVEVAHAYLVGRHGRRNDRARLTYQATCSQFQHRDGHVDPRYTSAALALYGRTGSGLNGPG